MHISRRDLLALSGTAAATAVMATGSIAQEQNSGATDPYSSWQAVRDLFDLSPDKVHMSAMLLASHPAPVREAIERHRRGLDADPVEYLEANYGSLTMAVREAAAAYLGIHRSHIALTDSTTMSVGLVYSGFLLKQGDEILTTEQDYFVTNESLRLAAARAGATIRQISLFDRSDTADADQSYCASPPLSPRQRALSR